MRQQIVSWLICDGRFRIHAVNAVGQREGRIIKIEHVDSGEYVQGAALNRLMDRLRDSDVGNKRGRGRSPTRRQLDASSSQSRKRYGSR
jgi:hypothetical protein